MVIERRTWLGDSAGAVFLEFTLLAGFLFTMLFGIVEFSYILWQWNATSKAALAGLRLAVVSNPVATEIDAMSGVAIGPAGSRISATAFEFICSTNCGANSGYDGAAMERILRRMQRFKPDLKVEMVQIAYKANGLGISASPAGVLPTVEVRIRGEYTFIFLAALGFKKLPLPDISYSMIAEDLKSTYGNP